MFAFSVSGPSPFLSFLFPLLLPCQQAYPADSPLAQIRFFGTGGRGGREGEASRKGEDDDGRLLDSIPPFSLGLYPHCTAQDWYIEAYLPYSCPVRTCERKATPLLLFPPVSSSSPRPRRVADSLLSPPPRRVRILFVKTVPPNPFTFPLSPRFPLAPPHLPPPDYSLLSTFPRLYRFTWAPEYSPQPACEPASPPHPSLALQCLHRLDGDSPPSSPPPTSFPPFLRSTPSSEPHRCPSRVAVGFRAGMGVSWRRAD